MINRLNSNLSFKSSNLFKDIPELNPDYTTDKIKARNITVLGSSKSEDSILDAMDLCSRVSKSIIRRGDNLLTGCGSDGILGVVYNTAKANSVKDLLTGKPRQNLAIVTEPPYGDEDIENCIPIGKASSEPERTDKFTKASNTFLIFPGRATTIQEAATLIQKNDYTKEGPLLKIILVGRKFFEGLKIQYDQLEESKLLKHKPEELFTIVDSEEEILKEINR